MENPAEGSNGFFREEYFDTADRDMERAGLSLSVTEITGDRFLISLRDKDGTRYSQIFDGVIQPSTLLAVLSKRIREHLTDEILSAELVSLGMASVKHLIRPWKPYHAYQVLSFEIVHGSHQASLSVIGDAEAFCDNILNLILNIKQIEANSELDRCQRFRRSKNLARLERDTARSDIRLQHLMTIARCYETANFDALLPLLAPNCVWESQWRLDAENGRDAVMKYYDKKGAQIRNSGTFPTGTVVELVGNSRPSVPLYQEEQGEKKALPTVCLLYTAGKLCLYLQQTINGNTNGMILDITLDEEHLISRIDICIPELFYFKPYKQNEEEE